MDPKKRRPWRREAFVFQKMGRQPSLSSMQISFTLKTGQKLALLPEVMEYLDQFRQIEPGKPESGGQLFFKLVENDIHICRATGPYKTDQQSRFSFEPDKKKQAADIKSHFKKGLHFLGDWHTHPEEFPIPSQMDLASMGDCFARSKHELESFLLLILGTSPGPAGMWISLHYKNGGVIRLQ